MLLALRLSRVVTRLSLPRLSAPVFRMKQTKINAFFVKRSSGTDEIPKSTDRRKATAEESDEEVKESPKKKSPVSVKKSHGVKNSRKRAIIYSDSEEEESSPKSSPIKSPPVKSPAKKIEKLPEPSPKKSSPEKAAPSKTSSKTPSKSSKDSKSGSSSAKKNGLSSVKNGRVTKAKKATPKAKKSTKGSKAKSSAASKSDSEEEKEEEVKWSDEEMEPMETEEVEKSPEDGKKKRLSAGKSSKTAKGKKSSNGSSSGSKSKRKSEPKSDSEKEEDSEDIKPVKTEVEKSPRKSTEKVALKTMKLESGQAVKGWNTEYDPSKSKYHPIDDASWSRGQSVPYLALAITLKKIEETSSRLKNIEILSNFFRSVILLSPQDLRFSIYLCLNKLAPAYEGVELGIAETSLIKAIAQSTGRSEKDIKNQLSEKDLGEIAESSRTSQKTLFQPAPLTVAAVFNKLKDIAGMGGKASMQKKLSMIQSMLVACKYSEARFVVRSLAGKLRIGLAEQSLLQAIAQACYLTPPNQNQADPTIDWPPKEKMINAGKSLHPDEIKARAEKVAFQVKSLYCECPNYDILVDALLKDGVEGLEEHCKLTPGIPPRPMLAQPTKGVEDILHRFTDIKFTCEYKYDGERAQIHLLEDGRVEIYSRNQENNTLKYPDIVNRFKDCIGEKVTSCILDSEAVAWDREKETILPFQVLSTRKRKDANESEIKVQVIIYGFDLIYLNGESLVKEPLVKRRELLKENFNVITGQFEFAKSVDTDSMEHVQEFLEESIKGNCEGLMVKTLDVNASYELAKRSHKWLKLKKDYLNTGGDSLDLVVIGGFLGKGKRTGTYGAYLLACYDPDNEEFQTICKLGTGFSDEDLEKHTKTLENHKIPKPKPYYQFHSNLTPDHWFDTAVVWEVKCADLSLSPVHKAAAGLEDPERGISLRFPRFIRIREDKNPEDATSASQVAQMYKNQDVVKNNQGNGKDFEDEFY